MPGMKITVDSAMRARDVSRPRPEHEAAAQQSPGGGPSVRPRPPRPGPSGSGPSPSRTTPPEATPPAPPAAPPAPAHHDGAHHNGAHHDGAPPAAAHEPGG